ncbi:MAG: DUF362 domain-containing protein [bacterium]
MNNKKEYRRFTRREFLELSSSIIISYSLICNLTMGSKGRPEWDFLLGGEERPKETILGIVEGRDIYQATKRAIVIAGGLGGIVSRGDIIIVKPNMSFDKAPEYGANTHPDVLRAVIDSVFEAGASKVYIFDNTVESARPSYQRSGLKDAGEKAGADVIYFNERDTVEVNIKNGKVLKKAKVHRLCLECDEVINVPATKTHNLTVLSLAIKNLMGLAGGDRWRWHKNISYCLADFYSYIRPSLTVLDASRVLLANGPSGGNLADVSWQWTILASRDGIACDSYATSFFGLKPTDVEHIRECADRGLGTIDLSMVKLVKERL